MTEANITSQNPIVNNIFSDNAPSYYEVGYNIIPLRAGTKIPAVNNWQHYCELKLDEWIFNGWQYSNANGNIGMPLGLANKVIALDFDNDIDNLHEEIIKLLEGSPAKKKGAKGFTAFYRYNGESPKKWYKDGKAVVELLSTGNQTVMPPSIHPDTNQPYIWLTPDTLLDINPEDLPYLPTHFIEKVDNLFGYTKKLINYDKHYEGDAPDIAEIEKALSFIPASEYATWITVGMSLHHTYGDAGFNVWDGWSCKAANYDAKLMQGKWRSFGKASNPVSVGTIFHHAVGCGYIMPAPEPFFDFEITSEFQIITGKEQVQAIVIPTSPSSNFPEHLLNAPGLPGEIAKWINNTSLKRQPILALGASLAAAGTIFAHRIRNDSNLRTNFMVLGLAESGAGKNHARTCIKSLFQASGLSHCIFGKFASDAGLLNKMDSTNSVGLALMDEIGRELKAINSKGAGGHETRILTLMMEIYSEAGTTFEGKSYANVENTKILVQPCLNIYSTSAPKRFYDSMTSDEAIDGFLARWLVFGSDDIDPPMQENNNIDTPPETLLESIKYITDMKAYKQPDPGIIMLQPIPDPIIIQYTEGARDILQKLTVTCNNNRVAEIKKGGNLAPIWARTREHAIKLALVAHPYRHGIIELTTMQWACELALYLSEFAIRAINENISDSEYEKNMQKIYQTIKKYNDRNSGAAMKQGELSDAIKNIDLRQRGLIINHLVESGKVTQDKYQYKSRDIYTYIAN